MSYSLTMMSMARHHPTAYPDSSFVRLTRKYCAPRHAPIPWISYSAVDSSYRWLPEDLDDILAACVGLSEASEPAMDHIALLPACLESANGVTEVLAAVSESETLSRAYLLFFYEMWYEWHQRLGHQIWNLIVVPDNPHSTGGN